MQWISLLLQFVNLRRNLDESKAIIEAAQAMAAKGKRYLVSLVGILFALFFLLAGFMLAIIELGMQWEASTFFHFSGLLISSTVFLGIGLIFFTISSFIALTFEAPLPPPTKIAPPEDRVKVLLEEFLLTFLTQLSTPEKERGK